jgi:hypothetical protein
MRLELHTQRLGKERFTRNECNKLLAMITTNQTMSETHRGADEREVSVTTACEPEDHDIATR